MIEPKKILPGMLIALGVAAVAVLISQVVPGIGAALIALFLGVVLRQVLGGFQPFLQGTAWTEKYVLETSIVLIGFSFDLAYFNKVSGATFGLVLGSVLAVLLLAMLLQKWMGEEGKLYWLLGAGSAICGSAAIGATAPLVGAKEEETGISMAVINLLGLLGMAVLPLLAMALQLTDAQTGIFLGGILQSMGHVAGAAFSVNDEVGHVATIVKMVRISLLVPFLLVVYVLYRRQHAGRAIQFPVFIVFFVLAVMLSQSGWLGLGLREILAESGSYLLYLAMAAIGLRIDVRALFRISGRAFVAGVAVFLFQIALYGFALVLLF